jgi:hypothetical protein
MAMRCGASPVVSMSADPISVPPGSLNVPVHCKAGLLPPVVAVQVA